MLEREFQSNLLRRLRTHPDLLRKRAVIYKHSNPFFAGMPDFSISIGYRTLWFELKMKGNKPTAIQAHFLKEHGDAGALIVASKDGREALISPLEAIVGWMSFDDLVKEIVSRCIV